jgi:hypothetical protein
MNRDYLVYSVVSSFIGGILWIIFFNIAFYSYFVVIGEFSIPFFAGIGTYVGLAYIGKIRKPSYLYGILIFIFSSVIYTFLYFISVNISWISFRHISDIIEEFILICFYYPVIWLFVGVGVIIGIILVRRMSASFCPHCGAELPAGRSPCPQCGKSP